MKDALKNIKEKPYAKQTALERVIIQHWQEWHLTSKNETEAEQAAVELEALRAFESAYSALEFDETTGECLTGCGGDSVDGHAEDCIWLKNYPQPKAAK